MTKEAGIRSHVIQEDGKIFKACTACTHSHHLDGNLIFLCCSHQPVSPGFGQANSANPFGGPTFSGNLQGLNSLGSNDFSRSQVPARLFSAQRVAVESWLRAVASCLNFLEPCGPNTSQDSSDSLWRAPSCPCPTHVTRAEQASQAAWLPLQLAHCSCLSTPQTHQV